MLNSIVVFAAVAVAVVCSSPAIVETQNAVSGWNELLGGKELFEESVNAIQSRSSDDAVILGELKEILEQDDIIKPAYLKYRTLFKTTNDATYARMNELKKNMMNIAAHNLEADAGKHTWHMGINHFHDMTSLELDALIGGFSYNQTVTTEPYKPRTSIAAPNYVNWVEKGIVSRVKQQGTCGTCAMFSSCAILESAVARKYNQWPLDLSPQELADCAIPGFQCPRGGSQARDSLNYMINNGISSLAEYPYFDYVGQCRGKQVRKSAWARTQQLNENNSEEGLKANLAENGPLVIYIFSSPEFHNYARGIFQGQDCWNQGPDHAVTLVGYGTENGQNYWLIKNSWDVYWGEKGYAKLLRNVCQVLNTAYSVTAY